VPLARAIVDALELLAMALGLVNIVLLVRRSIWNFPFGLAMVAITGVLVFEARLYSDAVLQVFFFAAQIYGWWAWAHAGGREGPVRVTRLSWPARAVWAAAIALLGLAWGAAMRGYTDAALPFVDSTLAVASMAAQILLARRCLENWVLWILVDVGTIAMYLSKDLSGLALLYVAFLILSALGLRAWRRAEREARAA
jgi:nicotinamide mononucleotide transporter